MEALLPWDQAFICRVDLTQRQKLVTDSAINVYKTVVLCTMMAGYVMVPGGALERSADELSRLLEEREKKAWELIAFHQTALKEAKDAAAREAWEAAEKEIFELNQKLALSEGKVEETYKQLSEATSKKDAKEAKESLSSFEKQVRDLNANCGRYSEFGQRSFERLSPGRFMLRGPI